MTDRVTIVPYDPDWPRRFDEERRALSAVFAGTSRYRTCRQHRGSGPWGKARHRHHRRCPGAGRGRTSDSSTRGRRVRIRSGIRTATMPRKLITGNNCRISARFGAAFRNSTSVGSLSWRERHLCHAASTSSPRSYMSACDSGRTRRNSQANGRRRAVRADPPVNYSGQ